MDLHVHEAISWTACVEAQKAGRLVADPRSFFPLLARGSWLNDTNQCSVFTNTVGAQKDKIQVFLRELWKSDCRQLLTRIERAPGSEPETVKQGRRIIEPASDACDDLGNYDFRDHMDILAETDIVGELKSDALGRTRTIVRSVEHALERLNTWQSARSQDRLSDWRFCNALGRAIHTIQDFFAHSNYVELLLWTLRPHLSPHVVQAFNSPVPFFESEPYERCYCPLPRDAHDSSREYAQLTARNTLFWYGETPATTPLVATVFVTSDTVYSLLEMYSSYLERPDGRTLSSSDVNTLLAVLGVPGRPVLAAGLSVYQAFRSLLEPIGSAVRGWLADRLVAYAAGVSESGAGIVTAAAHVVRDYDSAEAGDWARAGRLRYVSYTLQRAMAKELFRDNGNSPIRLPHHSLLRKDHALANPDDAARVRMACALATQATVELLCWAFSGACTASSPKAIIDRFIRHPRFQVDSQEGIDRLVLFVGDCVSRRWTDVASARGSIL